jgi:hypothetical protein
MFRTYAESRGLTTPRTFTAALADFRKGSADWFDGSLGSVDQRMSKCSKLLHNAQTAAASDPVAHLAAIAELSADHTALKNLREDLLTGASGREAGYTPPGQRLAKRLVSEDRRWVTLEGAKFFAAQEDARHDVNEMAERARRHAEVATSGLPAGRARLLTAAFEEAVATQARLTPRPRTASRRPVFTAFPDSQMFL